MRTILIVALLAPCALMFSACKSTNSTSSYNTYEPLSSKAPEPVQVDGGGTYKDPGRAQRTRNAFNTPRL